jgi:ankyrin repeat protein
MKSFRNKTNRRSGKSNRLTQKYTGGSPQASPKTSPKPKASKKPKASTKPNASTKSKVSDEPTKEAKELAFDLLAEFKKPKKDFNKNDAVKNILKHEDWNNKLIDFEDIDLTKNKPGITVLRSAVAKGDRKVVELLLQHGADVNKQNQKTEYTALHTAVANNGYPEEMIKMIKLLLDNGAKTDLEAKPLGTPLEWAEHYAEKNPDTYDPIVTFLKEHK